MKSIHLKPQSHPMTSINFHPSWCCCCCFFVENFINTKNNLVKYASQYAIDTRIESLNSKSASMSTKIDICCKYKTWLSQRYELIACWGRFVSMPQKMKKNKIETICNWKGDVQSTCIRIYSYKLPEAYISSRTTPINWVCRIFVEWVFQILNVPDLMSNNSLNSCGLPLWPVLVQTNKLNGSHLCERLRWRIPKARRFNGFFFVPLSPHRRYY